MSRRIQGSRVSASARGRQFIGLVVVIVVAIAASTATYFALDYVNHPLVNTNDKGTFSEYGFEIQYPVNSQMATRGVLSQEPDSQSGTVYWEWNGQTALIVLWLNTSGYNYTAGFNGVRSELEKNSTSVNVTGQGNTTIVGQSWVYETFQFATSGKTSYVTYATRYYQNEGRIYTLAYENSSPDTLSSVDSWGATFHG